MHAAGGRAVRLLPSADDDRRGGDGAAIASRSCKPPVRVTLALRFDPGDEREACRDAFHLAEVGAAPPIPRAPWRHRSCAHVARDRGTDPDRRSGKLRQVVFELVHKLPCSDAAASHAAPRA